MIGARVMMAVRLRGGPLDGALGPAVAPVPCALNHGNGCPGHPPATLHCYRPTYRDAPPDALLAFLADAPEASDIRAQRYGYDEEMTMIHGWRGRAGGGLEAVLVYTYLGSKGG